ncbi:MAG: DUF6786 family protein [Kiritimatiellales bacterium]
MNRSKNTFGGDVAFLQKHTDAIVLEKGKATVVVVPEYQGRVMTASACGSKGASSGWINYSLVEQGVLPPAEAAGKLEGHIYAFGGEERFWMGPEGGQYSIFFAPGKPFEFDDWFTPDPIDNEPWKVVSKKKDEIVFSHDFELLNHSGTHFQAGVERTVKLLDERRVGELLGAKIPSGLDMVAYQTVNRVINKGTFAWMPESGLLSIWMLSMFRPSPTTTVFIPYKQGDEGMLGPVVNADYFGTVPFERLKAEDGVIYFKCDGTRRGKIGVTPARSLGIAGSYDPAAGRMTLLVYAPPKEYFGYVNSMWKLQDEPYKGDALNSYNDGPVDASGKQMGPFYEIESSSPALALQPGESGTHRQTIIHFYGEQSDLQKVLSAVARVELNKVKAMFP